MAILLEYQDLETYHHAPVLNINVYVEEFVEFIKNALKEFNLNDSELVYVGQIKSVSMKLKSLDKSGAVTPEEFKKVENQARILKLLELRKIKKTLQETIKKETLEEIKNDLVVVPKMCPPPTIIAVSKETASISVSKDKPSTSDTDCFIVEEKSDIIPIISKPIEPEVDVNLDLNPLIRNILTKLNGMQIKKICKRARSQIRKRENRNNTVDGIIALPETVTPVKPKPPALIQKPVQNPGLVKKPVQNPVLVQQPVQKQNPVLVQNQFKIIRTVQNKFPPTNGHNPQPTQTVQQKKVIPVVTKPVTSNGNPTMKRTSTPEPIKTDQIKSVEKKQKIDDEQVENDNSVEDTNRNSLRVFIYNETIKGGTITEKQSGILTQKLLQIIDQDTSENCHLIRFDSYKLENGLFVITCANEFARNWLREKINLLENLWPSAALRITQNKLKFSKFSRLSVFVPAPVEPAITILKRIARQNPMLNTATWKIMAYHVKKTGVQLLLGMDEESFKSIQLIEMRPYYGLTRIMFREKFYPKPIVN